MMTGKLIGLFTCFIFLVVETKSQTCPSESETKRIRPGVLCLPEVKCEFGEFCVQNSGMPTPQMPLQSCCDACELGPPLPWRSCGKKVHRKDEHGRDFKDDQDCPYGYKCTFPSGDSDAAGVCCPDPNCPPTCQNIYAEVTPGVNCTAILGRECPMGLMCEVRDGFAVCCTPCDTHVAPIPGLVCGGSYDAFRGCPTGFDCKTTNYNGTGVCCPVEHAGFQECRLLETSRDFGGGFPLSFCEHCPFEGLFCEFPNGKNGECCTQCPGGALPIPRDHVDCGFPPYICPPGYTCIVNRIENYVRSAVCCPNVKDAPKKEPPPHCPGSPDTTSGRYCLGLIGKKCPAEQFCQVSKTRVSESYCCNPCKNGFALPGKFCNYGEGECPNNYKCVYAGNTGVCCPDPDSPPRCGSIFNTRPGEECKNIIGKGCPPGLLCKAEDGFATCCNPCEVGAPIPETVCLDGTNVQCPAGFLCVGTFNNAPGVCCPDPHNGKFPPCDLALSINDRRITRGENCGCKPGFQCECDEDPFGDCCNPCEFGSPLPPDTPGVACGLGLGITCPNGYRCMAQANDLFAVCCPLADRESARIPSCGGGITRSGVDFGCYTGLFYNVDTGECCFPCQVRLGPGPACSVDSDCPPTYECKLPTVGDVGYCCKDFTTLENCPRKEFIKPPLNCAFGVPLTFPPCDPLPCPPGYTCEAGNCCFNPERPPNCRKEASTFFPRSDCVKFIGDVCPTELLCEKFDNQAFARCCNPCEFGAPLDNFECTPDHACPFGYWCTGDKSGDFGVCCPEKPRMCSFRSDVEVLPGSYCPMAGGTECQAGFLCEVPLIPHTFPKAECCNVCPEGDPIVGRTCTPEPIGEGCPGDYICLVGISQEEGACCPVPTTTIECDDVQGPAGPARVIWHRQRRFFTTKIFHQNEEGRWEIIDRLFQDSVTHVLFGPGGAQGPVTPNNPDCNSTSAADQCPKGFDCRSDICCKETPPRCDDIGPKDLAPGSTCDCPQGFLCALSLVGDPNQCCNPCSEGDPLDSQLCGTLEGDKVCPTGFECEFPLLPSQGGCCEVQFPPCFPENGFRGFGQRESCKSLTGKKCPPGYLCQLASEDTEDPPARCCNPCDNPDDLIPGFECTSTPVDNCPAGFKCSSGNTARGGCCRVPAPLCSELPFEPQVNDGTDCKNSEQHACPLGIFCGQSFDPPPAPVQSVCCNVCHSPGDLLLGRVCNRFAQVDECPEGYECKQGVTASGFSACCRITPRCDDGDLTIRTRGGDKCARDRPDCPAEFFCERPVGSDVSANTCCNPCPLGATQDKPIKDFFCSPTVSCPVPFGCILETNGEGGGSCCRAF